MSHIINESIDRFNNDLHSCKPTLWHLADMLIEHAEQNGPWDVLLGDDTSGRLPTRFIRKVLEKKGLGPEKTLYVNASSSKYIRDNRDVLDYEVAVDLSQLEQQCERELTDFGEGVLVISEAADTFTTLGRIDDSIPESVKRNFAIVALGENVILPDRFKEAFIGTQDEAQARAVFFAFEAPGIVDNKEKLTDILKKNRAAKEIANLLGIRRNRRLSSYPKTGLVSGDQGSFTAKRSSDNSYRALTNHCYRAMDVLAEDYVLHR